MPQKDRPQKRKVRVDADKTNLLNAWHRVNCKTREALQRSFLLKLVQGYEVFLINKTQGMLTYEYLCLLCFKEKINVIGVYC